MAKDRQDRVNRRRLAKWHSLSSKGGVVGVLSFQVAWDLTQP